MKGSRSKRFAYHGPPDEKLIEKQDVPPDYFPLSKPERISFYCQSSETACWIMKYVSPVIQGTTRKHGPSVLHNSPSHFNSPTLGSTSLHYVCIYVSLNILHISSSSSVPVSSSYYSIYTISSPDQTSHISYEWGLPISPNSSNMKTSFFCCWFLPKQISSEFLSPASTPTSLKLNRILLHFLLRRLERQSPYWPLIFNFLHGLWCLDSSSFLSGLDSSFHCSS